MQPKRGISALITAKSFQEITVALTETLRDLFPIILVIGVFQFLILRQPMNNLYEISIGMLFVFLGLALFMRGLEMAIKDEVNEKEL